MPYITQSDRKQLEEYREPSTPGELNYALTTICKEYLALNPRENYSDYNEVIGVLECMKLEMYRRLVAPYEDIKIIENGDVF